MAHSTDKSTALVQVPRENRPRELVLLGRARKAIVEAQSIDEIRHIRDNAQLATAYVKKARLSKEIVFQASAVKLQAERRLGQMLGDIQLANSAPGNQHTGRVDRSDNQTGPIRLRDLGLSKSESSQAQRMASLPETAFGEYLSQCADAGREPTAAGLLRLVPPSPAASIKTRPQKVGDQVVSDLAQLVDAGRRFGCIYADPPWPYQNQATRAATHNHYPTMTIDQLRAEPVAALATDQAHLHLWTTNGFLVEALSLIEAWGFLYKSCFVWVKPQMGLGNYWRVSHELLLLGVRGNLAFLDRGQRSWVEAPRTSHSRKPHLIREVIQEVSPGPFLELYGRQRFEGWTVYGNQIEGALIDSE